MVTKKTFSMVLIFTITLLFLMVCSENGLENLKLNGSAVQEYNKSIEIYNKIAISFSDLAKAIKKELDDAKNFDEEFWKSYDIRYEKLLKRIQVSKEFQYKHKEIEIVKESIDSLIDCIELYINKVNDFRTRLKNYPVINFDIDINYLYEEALNKSLDITKLFNNIYDDYIIRK